MGRLLTMPSTSHRAVCRTSSVMGWVEFKMATNTRRMVPIILSHTPPWWDARGGLKTHSTSRRLAAWMTLARSSWRILRESTACAPTRFVPLSDHIFCGHMRLETNLTKALIKLSVSKASNISMCIARVLKHVNTHPYRLTSCLPRLTKKWPNTSTPVYANGASKGWHLLGGRFAIFCVMVDV